MTLVPRVILAGLDFLLALHLGRNTLNILSLDEDAFA
jgi:hypothetical protein